ncbi:hypothetical protein GCM10009837_12430 [Streptomyces durmitorensis]
MLASRFAGNFMPRIMSVERSADAQQAEKRDMSTLWRLVIAHAPGPGDSLLPNEALQLDAPCANTRTVVASRAHHVEHRTAGITAKPAEPDAATARSFV